MDKITYLAELAEGLARWVPERDRQDILRYYAEYFEEAGPDREAEVVAELGDPWALSSRLAVEGGFVTWEKAASWRHKVKWPGVLIGAMVGLSVFALVFAFGLVFTNIVRYSAGFTENPVRFVGEAEQVTFIDWSAPSVWGEYELLMEDPEGAMGYYWMDGENMASFSSIDVDISLGNIQVVAGDGCILSVGLSEDLGGYEPVWEVTDGVLKLRDGEFSRQVQGDSVSWVKLQELFSVGAYAVDVTITVPKNVVLDQVRVKTGLGDVLVYGVNAETVTAETGLGDVECYEARSVRRLGLSTGMGDVHLGMEEARGGLNISLKSGMGTVEATLCGFERDYAYTLASGMGDVTVNGSHRGSKAEKSGSYRLNAESGMGDVNVYFSGD